MAQLTDGSVDILSRDDGRILSQVAAGNSNTVLLNQPSVVKIHGTRAMVSEFERQGNDLVVHMRDGSTVRYQQFFFDDVDGDHSELVFDDGVNPPEHALFPVTSEFSDAQTVMATTPEYESLNSIDPLLLADTDAGTGVITAAGIGALGLAAIGIGALANSGGGNGTGNALVTPTIGVNTFAGDDVVSSAEKGVDQTLSGTTTGAEAGNALTVVLNGVTYATTIAADGTWSITIPVADLAALPTGSNTILVSLTNNEGATATTSDTITVEADAVQPGAPSITIAAFAGDDELDTTEQQAAQTISGTTINVEQGQTITVTLNGATYTATVDANGAWSVTVPAAALQALAVGTATITADVANVAGMSATGTHDFTVGSSGVSSITINQLSDDGYLNITEAQSDLTVSGFTTGITDGTVIRVTMNAGLYSATVNSDGSWSTTIPAADLQDLPQGSSLVVATATLADGTLVQNSSASALEVITTQPSASLNVPFGDAVLNSSEAGTAQTLTGNTGVSGPGQTIVATIGGTDYTGTVSNDGSWTVSIPPEVLQSLPQHSNDITVVVTDQAGNSATSTTPVNVVTAAPALTVSLPDGPVNQTDVTQPLTISGVSDGSQSVAVTLNGITYTTTVNPDGSWSVNIPVADLQQIASGDYPVTVTNTDSYGNSNTQTSTISFDTVPPTATIDIISGDGYVNAGEFDLPLNVTGTTQPGNTIVVSFEGVDLPATVDPTTGAWTAALTDDIKAAIADGTYVVTVVTTDVAGNSSEVYSSVTFATTQPVVSVNALTADGILNGTEVTVDQMLTGTATNVQAGREITLTLADGSTFTGTVEAGGGWSIILPAATLSELANGTQNYSVTVSDAAGNTGNITGSFDVAVDNGVATLTIGLISGDNALNATEVQSDLVISGNSAGLAAMTPLTVTFNGVDYPSAVNADGSWSVTVPASALTGLEDGNYTVSVAGTGADNNPVTSESELAVRAVFPDPTDVTVDSPFGDGVLNAAETAIPQTLSGNSGTTAADQVVTVNIGGVDYPAIVDATTGDWSLTLLPEVLQSLPNGNSDIIVTVTDSTGNTVNSTTPVTVDTATPAFTVDPVATDNIIDLAEQEQGINVTGTGSEGDTVTVTLGGDSYNTTVGADGLWTVSVPVTTLTNLTEGDNTVTVAVTSPAGNTASQDSTVVLDTAIEPALIVNIVADDDIVNATEAAQGFNVTGSVPDATTAVVVAFNGTDYSATVGANGLWSAAIPASALTGVADGDYLIAVTATPVAGDAATVPTTITLDTAAPVFTVVPVSGDAALNATEQGQPLEITGTGTEGDSVRIAFNGNVYISTVDADGNWTVTVPETALTALTDGSYPLNVTVTDRSGNTATQSSTLAVDLTTPLLTVNPLSGDNTLNAVEQSQPLTVSGTAENGSAITVTLEGVDYTTTAAVNGQWSLAIPTADLLALTNGDYLLTVTATDAAGNTTAQNSTLTVVADVDTLPGLTLDDFAGNNILDVAEQQVNQQFSGNTTNVQAGQPISVTLNGVTYTGTVQASGAWTITVPAADLASLPSGSTQSYVVSVGDTAGNPVTVSGSFEVNTGLSAVAVDPISEDGYLNAVEAQSDLTISGTASNLPEGNTVTVTFNGVDYTTTIQNGAWSLVVPATDLAELPDGAQTVTASATDAANNTVTSDATFNVAITALPAVTTEIPFTDGTLNATEATEAQMLTGSTGVIGDGQVLNVVINGQTYTGTVDDDGTWSLVLPASVLQSLPQGETTAFVTASDAAGNTATSGLTLNVDTLPPTVTVADIAGDNILNAAEQGSDLPVIGTGEVDSAIVVSLNGVSYTTTVDGDGQWTLTIPAADLANLPDGDYVVNTTATDSAGNSTTVDSPLTVKASAAGLPTLTIDPFASDDTINGDEQQTTQYLTGTTTHVEAGQQLTVTLNGVAYFTSVQASGAWRVAIPSSALTALDDGTWTFSVSVADLAGNPVTTTHDVTVTVDAGATGISIDPLSTDGYLNAVEAQDALIVTGTTMNIAQGTPVTVTFNGQTFTGAVGADGTWNAIIPASSLAGLPDGVATLTAAVTEGGGTTITSDGTLNVQVNQLPLATADAPFNDGLLNASETATAQTLTGTTGLTGDGQIVTVVVGGITYTGTVDADGNWSVSVPAGDLQALPQGDNTLQVTVADAAGNTSVLNVPVSVDTVAPTVTLNTIAGDGMVNAGEAAAEITVSGTSSDAEEGQLVTVSLVGQDYTTVIAADGSWTLQLPAGLLQTSADGTYTLTASLSDAAGNTTTATSEITLSTVSLQPTLDTPFADSYLNATEAQADQTLSGTTGVTGAGQAVTVNIAGTDYSATVDANGGWTLPVTAATLQALGEGIQIVTVTATDVQGNTGTTSSSITVDYTTPELTVDPIAGDNTINAAESLQPITIGGTASLSEVGQLVTVTFDGTAYQQAVQSDGSWLLNLPSGVVQGLANGDYPVTVSLTDSAGNVSTQELTLNVDAAAANLPAITLNLISGDNYINQVEAGQDLIVTGSVTNVTEGQTVTVTLNSLTYTARVLADGSWSTTVPAADLAGLLDGAQNISAAVVDVAGNPASVTGEFTVVAQAADLPTITIDPVTSDDVINSQEALSDVQLSGSSQHIPVGGTVTVAVNGNTYAATVDADGSWTATVPVADMGLLAQGGVTVTASGSDVAGNVATATSDFTVDTILPVLDVTLSAGADNLLNLSEAEAGLVVSGTTDAGLPVTVTLNNKTYSATAAADGTWSLTIGSGDLLALPDGQTPLTVTVTDASGNTATSDISLGVAINALPALTLDTPFTDSLVNAAEAGADQILTGTATNLIAGTAITVSLEGLTFAGVVNADGTWSATIPAGSLTDLVDGAYQLAITATDAAGNPASASASIELLVAPLPGITIATPFVDGLLNATEAGVDQLINGNTGITGAGQTVTLNIDGNDITATVEESGVWSATLTPTLAATLGNGDHTITVNVADRAGNTSTNTLVYTAIVTDLPDPTLVQPFTDGVLNAAEAAAGGTLDGTTGITGAQTVSVDINGTSYPATVDTTTGAWSLDLSAATLTTLPDGTWPITVTVTDAVGNVATATDSLLVAVNTLPAVTINLPFGDGQLNVAEAAETQTVSGTTGITGTGQTVAVSIDGGTPLTATVNTNGNWSLDLSSEQLTALGSGSHTFAVTATDSAGNANTGTLDFNALLALPQPTVDGPLFTDGFLNIAEAGAAITLTGTTGVTDVSQDVQLQIDLDGIVYTGTVAADGTWAVLLPAGALNSLTDGTHTLNLTVIDAAGNTNTSSLDFTSLLTPPVPTLAVPFDNSFMNGEDLAAGAALTGTTGVTGDGQAVTVTIGATNYSATVATNGAWTLDLSSAQLSELGEGLQNVTVVATDAAGNPATVTGSFTVDTIAPTVNIDLFTGEGALDYLESLTTQQLTGTSDATEGQIVTVTIGTASVEGVVAADGSWSVNLTPDLMAQLGTTGDTGTITASISDIAGNAGTATTDVTVDLTPPLTPLFSLDPISGDNIVNSTDGATLTLSGTFANLPTVGGVVTGIVAVTINGVAQAATAAVVAADGTWTITVPDTAGNLEEGTANVTATLTTGQGTTLTSTSQVLVDRTVPTVTINTFAGDDILNSSEAAASQTISGTASVSEAGRTVTVTLNAKTYTAIVQADGSWSATVGAGDLQALAQSGQTITATVTDAAGNVGTGTHDFTVDTAAPLIEVNALLGDNLLNAADILTTQTVTGTASGAEGQTISLYVGDSSPIATAVVDADGTFSLDLTPEVLGSLTDGPLVFGLRVSDAAGNASDATLTVNKVVNAALNLVVDPVFGDGFLNAADTAVAQTITGLASSAGVGATVSLTLGGTTVSTEVGQDGQFALEVPADLLGLLSDGDTSLNLVLTDAAGNTRTVVETVTTILEAPVINALTGLFGGDNLLNIAEAAVAQTISGTVNGTTGSTVTVTLGSKSYQTTLQANGEWSISVPALDLAALTTGDQTLGVTVVDPAGNTSAISTTVGIFTAQPTITLGPIFGDGILNIADALINQTISGTVNNVAEGSIVNLTLGDATVTATVGQNGAFTATVTPAILSTLADDSLILITASVTDAAGNSATTSSALLTKLTAPVISIAQLFGDGLLNLADAALGQNVTGTITGAESGSRVVVTVAGTQFVTSTAEDGTFSVALTPEILKGLADGNLTVGVSVTDMAGNTSSATADAIVGVHSLPTVTLNPLFGDGILNLAESLVTQTISGTATNVASGSTVTIALGNTTVTAVVDQNGDYSAQISPAILSTLLDGNLTASVTVNDAVGNVASITAGLKVGIHATPTLTVNPVFGDSILSASDLSTVQTISGTATNVAAGSTVAVTLNNVTYTTTVNSSGGWTLNVPEADLSALPDSVLTVNATVTDSAYGNTATSTATLTNTAQTPPVVTISSIFGDGLLNAVDATTAQTITGTTTNAEGSILTVQVGTATVTTTVSADGTWSVSLPAATLAALADGTSTVTASVTNYVGNTGTGSDTVVIKTHTMPTVAITTSTVFGGDHYLNLSEANVAETISGTSTNAAGSTVTVNVAGNVYTTTVGSAGEWSVTVPSATLSAIADGSYTITATVTDPVGNTATGSDTFTAITHNLPIVGVDPVLSLVSVLLTGLTISGGTLNLASGTTVNVTLNGTTQTATLDALGRYSTKFTGGLLTALNLSSIVTVTAVDLAGNPASTSTTLLLGSLLPTTTSAAAAATTTTLLAVAADDATTATTAADTSDTTTDQTAAAVQVATTSSEESDTDSSTVASTTSDSTTTTDDTSTATTAATSDDSAYTIGGLVITFADGHTAEGASVTGGTGDDTITLNTNNFTLIDGGAGTDTLVLNGENMTLDLTSLGLKVGHIEVINLGSSGTNSVKLDLNEALNITDSQSDDLVIKGGTGDQVTLANGDGGIWATTAQRTVDGQVYDVYHNSTLASTNTLGDVLIQHALQVNVV